MRAYPAAVFLGLIVLFSVGMSACGASSQPHVSAQVPTPFATVPYLPPTVVPLTPTPSPTAIRPTATPIRKSATPTPIPRPRPTAIPPTPTPSGPAPQGGIPNISGQLILVSINQQWLWAYQNRRLLYDTPVTTGRPELPTPDGIYHVQYKLQNVEFYSAWPPGSPYYYAPEHVDFALYFLDVGYYIHSATWRYQFGPGTEVPHTDSNGKQETGSHGCVEVPYNAGAWLYQWAYDGATVDITGTTPAPVATPTPTTAPVNTPTPTPTSLPPTPTALPPTETPTP